MRTLLLNRPATGGKLTAVSSKADVHRALIAASLSTAKTKISCLHPGDDIAATCDCLCAMGAAIDFSDDAFTVSSPVKPGFCSLDCHDSGSTLRFLLPVAAALACHATVDGSNQLRARPIVPLLDCLCEHGADISSQKLPLTLGGRLDGGAFSVSGDISSQFVTGLMLALPLLPQPSSIVLTTPLKSAPYINMTMYTLGQFGVHWRKTASGFSLLPCAGYRTPGTYNTDGDWSSAAPFLAAAAISGRVEIEGLSLSSRQADKQILTILAEMGAFITVVGNYITVEKGRLSPFEADLSDCPDLFPTLAVLACAAKGESTLTGIQRLRLKESDRLSAVCEMLTALGADLFAEEDALTVRGTGSLSGGTVKAYGDHRIVMAAATARSLSRGDITVLDAEAVSKSYPTFFEDYERLGGHATLG